MIEFEAEPDRVRLTAAYRRHMRGAFVPYRGTGLALAGLAVVALLPAPRMVATLLASSAVLFIFFSPALLLHHVVTQAWRRNRGSTSWTLSEEGLRAEDEGGYGLTRWSEVTRVEQLRDQLYVKLEAGRAIFLPTVALSAEKQQELLDFLRARDLLA